MRHAFMLGLYDEDVLASKEHFDGNGLALNILLSEVSTVSRFRVLQGDYHVPVIVISESIDLPQVRMRTIQGRTHRSRSTHIEESDRPIAESSRSRLYEYRANTTEQQSKIKLSIRHWSQYLNHFGERYLFESLPIMVKVVFLMADYGHDPTGLCPCPMI
jgi:hypothetical protein